MNYRWTDEFSTVGYADDLTLVAATAEHLSIAAYIIAYLLI